MATIISSKTSGVGGLTVTGDASGVLQLASADGTTAVTIDASQNVGIGTASPAQKLDVTGNINTSGSLNSINTFGFKNRIINGGMVIDQRNAGASVTPTHGQYLIDRWFGYQTTASKYSAQQTTTAPAGFINSFKATSLSAYTVGAADVFTLGQVIEGFNISDLAWGTASASAVTLSFRVYSSLTGTFGGVLKNSANTRSYPFTYSIPSANTWTTISITIAGDTSGTWLTTNGIGITIYFGLGVGSTYSGTAGSWSGNDYYGSTGATSVVGTSGATFYITGVQLEKGSTATSFDYRPYGTELALCQRYYQQTWDGASANTNLGARGCISQDFASTVYWMVHSTFQVPCRTAPTVTIYSPSGVAGKVYNSSDVAVGSSVVANNIGTVGFRYLSNGTSLQGTFTYHYSANAEL